MNTRRLLGIALALCALALPTAAHAAGPVHDAIRADRLPPAGQATVRVVPPRGGTVMLYRDGKVAGWWMHPGFAHVDPYRPYGIMAMRGTHVLFHAGLTVNPGLTELVWDEGNTPRIGYVPPVYMPHAHAQRPHRPHGAPQAHAPARTAPARRSVIVQQLRQAPSDDRRLTTLKRHLTQHRLSSGEVKAVLGTFHANTYKSAASRVIKQSAAAKQKSIPAKRRLVASR